MTLSCPHRQLPDNIELAGIHCDGIGGDDGTGPTQRIARACEVVGGKVAVDVMRAAVGIFFTKAGIDTAGIGADADAYVFFGGLMTGSSSWTANFIDNVGHLSRRLTKKIIITLPPSMIASLAASTAFCPFQPNLVIPAY